MECIGTNEVYKSKILNEISTMIIIMVHLNWPDVMPNSLNQCNRSIELFQGVISSILRKSLTKSIVVIS